MEYGSARGSDLGKDLVAELSALTWLILGKEKPRRSRALFLIGDGDIHLGLMRLSHN